MSAGITPKTSPSVLATKMVPKPQHMPTHVHMSSGRRPAFSMMPIAMKVIATLTSDSRKVAIWGSATLAWRNISVE